MAEIQLNIRNKSVNLLPEEVLFDGVVVSGDKTLEIWREAFRRLTAVDPGEKAFRAEFLEEIQQEINSELKDSYH